MIPQLPIAMLACARIGAIHSVVFSGFSSTSLRDRIQDCKSGFLVTQDNAMRGGIIEHVYMRNVKVGQVARAALDIDFHYEEGDRGGFTPIVRDVEIIKRELPIDILEFFFLTPLPGSEDHKTLSAKGVWMDPDMNKYDLNHRVSHHGTMSDSNWEDAYRAAWHAFYTPEHINTILRRTCANPIGRPGTTLSEAFSRLVSRLLFIRGFLLYRRRRARKRSTGRVLATSVFSSQARRAVATP